MSTVGFVVHPVREEAVAVASELSGRLEALGVTTRRLPAEHISASEAVEARGFAEGLDLAVAVGGDGTFLRAAEIAWTADVPLAGVKVGRLGFLTEAEPDEAMEVIQGVLEGRGRIEERLAVVARSDAWEHAQWALNEIMVEKQSRHRLVKLAVRVDGTEFCTFSADGVIVATSTGSTAYSFSARGPIVSPAVRCMVVTPVAAHMVFDRSLVLADHERLSLEVVGEEAAEVSADGRASTELPVGAVVSIAPAERPLRMVRRADGTSFFSIVRDKFGLPGGTA
jgi:NAD+ kinase